MTSIKVFGVSPISKQWKLIAKNALAIHNNGQYVENISTWPGYTYIVTENGYIVRNAQASETWEGIEGLATDISADYYNYYIYAISKQNKQPESGDLLYYKSYYGYEPNDQWKPLKSNN